MKLSPPNSPFTGARLCEAQHVATNVTHPVTVLGAGGARLLRTYGAFLDIVLTTSRGRVWGKPINLMRLITILLTLILATPLIAAPKKPKKKMEAPKPPVGEKPDVTRLEPRGLQTGTETEIKLIGTNFIGMTAIKFSNPKLTATIDSSKEEKNTEAWIKVKAARDLPRGTYDLTLVNPKGTSAAAKIYADELPQVQEMKRGPTNALQSVSLPVSFWGTINPMGDVDEIEFHAKIGQTLVFDLTAKSIGSKLEAALSLLDAKGLELAGDRKFDGGDSFIAYTVKETGVYRARITDADANGSLGHFYRLSMGELPTVVGIYPLAVAAGTEQEINLIGYNLGDKTKVKIKAGKSGEMDMPINEKLRPRRAFKLMVTDTRELVETEPNDTPGQATPIIVPGAVNGRIWPTGKAEDDVDLYRFEAQAGKPLMIETDAARRGSPADTKVEVLWPDGKPVAHLQLQAVRNSSITFKDIDSADVNARVENWQEMELDQYLFMEGEVCRIFRMPEGPDSGFQFYKSFGRRENYFHSSATTHALDETCYIVEPHAPDEKLSANGLPVFPIYYANDDDSERELGTDSRLQFIAPKDGPYLIRVTDSRSHGGERYTYHLSVREAKPDFRVTLNGLTPTINPGSGQEFTVSANRIDGFDGPITVEITGMPKGFAASSPIVVQAGHLEASGTINAETNAMAPTAKDLEEIKASASAMVDGGITEKSIRAFSQIIIGTKPALFVALEPYHEGQTNFPHHKLSDPPMEITIAPGQIVPVWLKIERLGHEDLATFTAENLPHGVIIDNIGLNGVLIAKGENYRQIFFKAAKWVPETDRLCYVQAKQAGLPTSQPVLLHVKKPKSKETAQASVK